MFLFKKWFSLFYVSDFVEFIKALLYKAFMIIFFRMSIHNVWFSKLDDGHKGIQTPDMLLS